MSVSVNDIGFALCNLYSYNDKAWIWMSFLGSLYLKIQFKKKKSCEFYLLSFSFHLGQ